MSQRTDEESQQHLIANGNNPDDGFTRFCNRLGIALNTRNSGPTAILPSIFQDLLDKRKEYRTFYVLLLTVAIIAVILQIALGIIISALSGIDPAGHKVAIIVLGATNTFVGFVSGWIQYQGQPTRSGQYADALDVVRTEILGSHGELKNKGTIEEGDKEGIRIKNMYKQAVADALANQPTVWSRGGNTPDLRGQNPSGLTQNVADRTENLFNGNSQNPDQPRRTGGSPLGATARVTNVGHS